MRILSENETALLIGDLSKIKIPKGIELYVSVGITQLFKKLSNTSCIENNRDWLYIPIDTLNSCKQNISNVPYDSVDGLANTAPIACGDYALYPVYAHNGLKLILSCEGSSFKKLKKETIKCLVNTYKAYKEKIIRDKIDSDKFLDILIENNESIIDFTKSVLNLIIKNIPRCCAGYHTDDQNGLRRKMIMGDLSKFDLIPPKVNDELKAVWNSRIEQSEHFIPVTNLIGEAQFLLLPPDFLYVHKGLNSKYSENYITVLVPGTTDIIHVQFLKTITSMMQKFSEKQFLKSTSVISYYRDFMNNTSDNYSVFNLSEKLFSLLNKQLRITKLLVHNVEKTTNVSFTTDGTYYTNEFSTIGLALDVKTELRNSNGFLIRNILDDINDENTESNQIEESATELYYQFNLPDGKTNYLVLGTSKRVDAVQIYLDFIKDAIDAYIKCRSCQISERLLQEAIINQKILSSRMNLISDLSNGYFHEIFSKMTVLLGKTEHLKNLLINKQDTDQYEAFSKYLNSIENNADLVGDYALAIHALTPNNSDYYTKKMNSVEMMKKIPQYMNGYLHHTNVTKNISLRMDNLTQMKLGFLISGAELDDVILPILMSIVDNAKKDGTISFAAHSDVGDCYIKISFNSELIEDDDIAEIIRSRFEQIDVTNNRSGTISIGSLTVSHTIDLNSMVDVKIQFRNESLVKNNANDMLVVEGI